MYGINSTYYQVQAIRRRLADSGIRTHAKPFYGYAVVCNFPTAPAPPVGETATGTVGIDADSYFLWISTSKWASTDAITLGSFDVPPVDAEPFGNPTPLEYSMRLLKSGRRLHTPEFIPLVWLDWRQPTGAADGDTVTPVSIFGGEVGAGTSYHGFRAPWPEPVLMNPKEMLEIRMRVRNTFPLNRVGHLFVLNGVKLFPGSA